MQMRQTRTKQIDLMREVSKSKLERARPQYWSLKQQLKREMESASRNHDQLPKLANKTQPSTDQVLRISGDPIRLVETENSNFNKYIRSSLNAEPPYEFKDKDTTILLNAATSPREIVTVQVDKAQDPGEV